MKISIIVPHFNSPASLRVLLKSIFEEESLLERARTLSSELSSRELALADLIQVIVTDDNSTAEVELYNQVRTEFEAAYTGAVIFQRNIIGKNASGTCRNFGLQMADGQWIMFADSDDYFTPGWYKIVSEYFDQGYDLIHFLAIGINQETGEPANREYTLLNGLKSHGEPGGWKDIDVRTEFHPPWGKLISHELIKTNNIKFPPSLWGDDTVFSIQVGLLAKKIHVDKRAIYCLVESDSNVTSICSPLSLEQLVRNSAHYDAFVRRSLSDGAGLLKEHGQITYQFSRYLLAFGYKGILPGLRFMGAEAFHFVAEQGIGAILKPCRQRSRLKRAVVTGKPIYIFGNGTRGRELLKGLGFIDGISSVKAFVVSDTKGIKADIGGVPVVGIDEILPLEGGAMLMVALKSYESAVALLEEKGVKDYEVM